MELRRDCIISTVLQQNSTESCNKLLPACPPAQRGGGKPLDWSVLTEAMLLKASCAPQSQGSGARNHTFPQGWMMKFLCAFSSPLPPLSG